MIRFDDYQIEADNLSINAYRVGERTDMKTGKTIETKTLVGYYGTLEGAVEGCRKDAIRRHIAEDNVETLSEAVEEVRRITQHFNDVLAGIGQIDRA